MDPIVGGAIIGGGIGLIGGMMGNQARAGASREANALALEMRNNAHQVEAEDLRLAGYNPMLTGGPGGGAPAAAISTPELSDVLGNGAALGVNTGMSIKQQRQQSELTQQNIHAAMEDVAIKNYVKAQEREAARTAVRARPQVDDQNKIVAEDAKTKLLQNKLLRETLPHMVKEAKAKGDFSQVNQIMGVLKSGASTASDISDLNPIKPKIKIQPGK